MTIDQISNSSVNIATAKVPTIMIAPSQIICTGLSALLTGSNYEIVACGPKIDQLDEQELVSYKDKIIVFVIESHGGKNNVQNEIVKIKNIFKKSKIIILATYPSKKEAKNFLKIGVDAYLLPNSTPEILNETIGLVLRNQNIFPSEFTPWNVNDENEWSANNQALDIEIDDLSNHEKAILQFLVDGMSNKEIGLKMDMPDSTIKLHLLKIQNKINARNRVQAAVWASINGLYPISEYKKIQ